MVKKIFVDTNRQETLETAVSMLINFGISIKMTINSDDPLSVIAKLESIVNSSHEGVAAKAKLDYLLDGYVATKIRKVLDLERERSAADRKAILQAEVADLQYYCTFAELLIKESHYHIEALRSLLSWHKTEAKSL